MDYNTILCAFVISLVGLNTLLVLAMIRLRLQILKLRADSLEDSNTIKEMLLKNINYSMQNNKNQMAMKDFLDKLVDIIQNKEPNSKIETKRILH